MQHFSPVSRLIARFRADRAGNVAMVFAICALPLLATAGFAVDLHRHSVARAASQEAADAAALAAAVSGKKTQAELAAVVEAYLGGNMDVRFLAEDYVTSVDYIDEQRITVTIDGGVHPIFAGVIGISRMDLGVAATAVRGTAEAVELVLVLDNTDSMNQADAGGKTRIASLKTAATDLVAAIKENEDADVKVGVVPYGEFVNVGKANKGASWLSLAEYDQYVPAKSQGKYPDEETYCKRTGTPYTVEREEKRDGYTRKYTQTVTPCAEQAKRPHPQAGQNKPDSKAYNINWRWQGCVYSRLGTLRLSDDEPTTPYHGLIERDANPDCMTEILPLTPTHSTITAAINGMRTTVSGRIPQTYIPAGLMWGINVLSPTAPFIEGKSYASGNRNPRKIMVLMTDGENTMRYKTVAGKGYATHEVTAAAGQIKQTNDDVTALCDYAKSRDIELYTVALGVSGPAQTMLQDCATEADFFFNATDNAALEQAFADIAASINRVRLVR